MKANGWVLDENRGGEYWMKTKGWILDESKRVDFG
jgi:hypothetical protein